MPREIPDSGTGREPWVGKRVVASHFGVCVRTIENWMVSKHVSSPLPHHKRFPGSHVKFKLSECDEWYARECSGH